MNVPIIEVKHVSYSYQKEVEALEDVSFKVEKGEYVTLIGHNGSGKSTLAKLLCFLYEPTKGEVLLNGIKESDATIKDIRRTMGIVFQNPDNQFIGGTVEDDIAFGLENRNIGLDKMKELVHEYAKKVNMERLLNKEPSEISGGQKQRVAIAGILALGLKIVIFDEATSMLDPEGVEDIKCLINEMRVADPELTFISITHDIEEAFMSDRVIIMNNHRIFKDGTPNEVFNNVDEIKSIGLDAPFILKVKDALNKKGVTLPSDAVTLDSLARSICKLK